MIEYPSIQQASKAPRMPCIAFEKLDGSNIRVKYTPKNGFDLFGSRHELIDESHPHLGQVVPLFNENFAPALTDFFRKDKEYRNEKEIIVFGEFFGPNSFAGIHDPNDPKEFVLFDVYLSKPKKFVTPREFVKTFSKLVKTPEVIFEGNFGDQFILDVQHGKYPVNEGVIAKGTQTNGAYRGHVWMAKVKTFAFLQKLKDKYGLNWELYV